MSDGGHSAAIETRGGVLLPAEPGGLFMSPEQYEAFARTMQKPTRRAVTLLDPLPGSNEQKHAAVKTALLTFGAAQLQSSVKELRGVPTEALALGMDLLIHAVVGLVRGGGE